MTRTSMTQPFESPHFLLKTTRENLQDFRELCRSLFNDDCQTNVVEIDPATGNKTFKIKFKREIPSRARHIPATALNDLRHTLDQAMCETFRLVAPREDITKVYFPFSSHPNHLASVLAKFTALPREIITAIESSQPYPRGQGYTGGDDLLVKLNAANANKHRVTCNIFCYIKNFTGDSLMAKDPLQLWTPPAWDMEKNELIVGVTGPEGDLIYDFGMTATVVFTNASSLTGAPVARTIEALIGRVGKVVDRLQAACGAAA